MADEIEREIAQMPVRGQDPIREQTIQGLRELADFLERNPVVPLSGYTRIIANLDADSVEVQREKLREIARLAGGTRKEFFEDTFWLQLRFRTLTFEIAAKREAVCRKVTREKVLPAEAEKVIPAKPKRTVIEEEWVCDEPLLAKAAPALESDGPWIEGGSQNDDDAGDLLEFNTRPDRFEMD